MSIFKKSYLLSILTVISLIVAFSLRVYGAPVSYSGDICHIHTGNTKSGGGCYTKAKVTTKIVEVPCPGKMVYFPDADKTQCSYCGAGYFGDQSGRDCYYSTTREEKVTTYELNCGKTAKTVLGTFEVTKSTDEWCRELDLCMSVTPDSAVRKTAPFFAVDGTPVNEYRYTVNECRTYSVALNTAAGYSSSPVSVDVSNIDTTGPSLMAYSLDPPQWSGKSVTVTLTSVSDLQPDQSAGCGLHDTPYSFDSGATWTSENHHTYSQNSNYEILIRDKLNNVTTEHIVIDNIDTYPPRILSVDYDHTLYVKSVNLVINADDIMPDNRPGVGLHSEAYSFDGGETWSSDNTLYVDKCCTKHIAVRDKLGNVSTEDLVIDNIDCYGPVVSHVQTPVSKTTSPVTVTFFATDVGYNNSPGIGLPDNLFSYDGGLSWTMEASVTVSHNAKISVMARDKNDNITVYSMDVANIYKPSPTKPVSSPDTPPEDEPPFTDTPVPTPTTIPAVTKAAPVNKPTPTVPPSDAGAPKPPVSVSATPTPSPTIEAVNPTVPAALSNSDSRTVSDITVPKDNSFSFDKLIIFLAIGLFLAALLLLLLFYLYRKVLIYNYKDKDRLSFKGIGFVHCTDTTYEVNITQSVLDSCETNRFVLRFSILFSALHKNTDVVIYLPDKQSYIVKPSTASEITIRL